MKTFIVKVEACFGEECSVAMTAKQNLGHLFVDVKSFFEGNLNFTKIGNTFLPMPPKPFSAKNLNKFFIVFETKWAVLAVSNILPKLFFLKLTTDTFQKNL